MFGVDFAHLPVDDGGRHASKAEAKAAQEGAIQATLAEAGVDLIVLARYMQARSRRGGGAAARGCPLVGAARAPAAPAEPRAPAARAPQIFSRDFCAANWRRTINIHHS